MRLHATRNQPLTFSRRRHAKGSLLIGIALASIGALPLALGEGPLVFRLATTLVVGGVAALLIAVGWPRRQVVVIAPEARTITMGHEELPLEQDAYFRFVARVHGDDYAWPTYRVEVATPARAVTILDDRHPDRVLRDFSTVHEALPLAVQTGWGLPASATPWERSAAPGSAPRDGEALHAPLIRRTTDVVAQRETGWTVVLGSFAVALLMLRVVVNRISVGDTALTQDIVLPIISVAIVATIGTVVLTRSVVVRSNGTVCIEHRALGLTWRRLVLPRESVTGAFAVGAAPGRAWHLLMSTTQGPVSVPCYDGGAREVSEALTRRL